MRGLTGERPEKEGRRRVTGRGGDEEGKRQVTEGRDDLRDDMLQTLLRESVGVAIAIGIAITVCFTLLCNQGRGKIGEVERIRGYRRRRYPKKVWEWALMGRNHSFSHARCCCKFSCALTIVGLTQLSDLNTVMGGFVFLDQNSERDPTPTSTQICKKILQ